MVRDLPLSPVSLDTMMSPGRMLDHGAPTTAPEDVEAGHPMDRYRLVHTTLIPVILA